MKTKMSADEARRIALAAQGFATPRPTARLDRRHLRGVIAQIGLLQIDSVNVLVRSHYLPLFSRLGGYAPEILDASWIGAPATRELFEYWGHMASLMPFEMHPLLRWRMAAAAENHKDNDTRVGQLNRSRPGFMQAALDEIASAARSALARSPARARAGADGGDGATASARLKRCSPRANSRRRDGAASSACTICRRELSRRESSRCQLPRSKTRSVR